MQTTGSVQGANELPAMLEPPSLYRRLKRRGITWSSVLFYIVVGFFILNLLAMVATVVLDSFAQSWFGTWLPSGLTPSWYQSLNDDADIGQLLFNTLFVAIIATVIALLVGFPAAYVLARKQFRFKGLLTGLFLLPMLVPPLAYGIPLASLLLSVDIGGSIGLTLVNVVIANLVPIIPFVILILTPFIEQVDTSLESASRMLGANRLQTFRRVVLPLIVPGLLTAGILAIVRVIAMFELTFLVADASSQTLVLQLYGDALGAGIRPEQTINALAVVYMLTSMAVLGIALIFVKPTQFVVRIKER